MYVSFLTLSMYPVDRSIGNPAGRPGVPLASAKALSKSRTSLNKRPTCDLW